MSGIGKEIVDRALEALLKDPDFRKEIALACSEEFQSYTIEQVCAITGLSKSTVYAHWQELGGYVDTVSKRKLWPRRRIEEYQKSQFNKLPPIKVFDEAEEFSVSV